jgi:hypothetical protein
VKIGKKSPLLPMKPGKITKFFAENMKIRHFFAENRKIRQI